MHIIYGVSLGKNNDLMAKEYQQKDVIECCSLADNYSLVLSTTSQELLSNFIKAHRQIKHQIFIHLMPDNSISTCEYNGPMPFVDKIIMDKIKLLLLEYSWQYNLISQFFINEVLLNFR